MPFNVEMPDGTIIQDVPDGTTKDQIQAKYQAHLSAKAAPPIGDQPSILDRIAASPIGRLAHDVIGGTIEGALQGPDNVNQALSAVIGDQIPTSRALIEQPYQAALARNRNTPGYAAARAKADAAVKGFGGGGVTDQLTAPLNSAIAGLTAAPGGLDMMNAASDAQTAAQQGFSAQHPILSTAAQIGGGLLLAPKLPTPNAPSVQAIPSIADLKSAAGQAYDRVDQAGHVISAPSYDNMVGDLQQTLANEGIDKTLHPNALAAYNRLEEAKGQPITFNGLDTMRKIAGDAIGASVANKADQRLGYVIQNHIDDFVNGLTPNDLIGRSDPAGAVNDLAQARDLWSRASQASIIQKQIDKAGIKAQGYSQSGMENALRAQFRQLALNDKAMARLSPEVRDAVLAVAKGSPVSNILRAVGKYAPHGPVATMAGLGTGMMLGGPMGAAEGGMASLAVPMAGEAARASATAMTKAAAKRALDTAALGQAPTITTAFRAPSLPPGNVMPYALPLPLLLQTQNQ